MMTVRSFDPADTRGWRSWEPALMRWLFRVVIAAALTSTALAARASSSRLDHLSTVLKGQWTVTVGRDARTRIWEIDRVLEYEPGFYLAEGTYGFKDGSWTPVLAEIHDTQAAPTIILGTTPNSILTLTIVTTEKLAGEFRAQGGPPRLVALDKVKEHERAAQTPHPAVSALQRPLREAVWAASMSAMPADVSWSAVAAPLPPGLTIRPPHLAVPQNWARFSGRWSGWACYFGNLRACDTRLAVLAIYGDRALVIHTWGAKGMAAPRVVRTIGRFVGEELFMTFPNQNTANYRFRRDGNLEVIFHLYNPSDGDTRVGVLMPERSGPDPSRASR